MKKLALALVVCLSLPAFAGESVTGAYPNSYLRSQSGELFMSGNPRCAAALGYLGAHMEINGQASDQLFSMARHYLTLVHSTERAGSAGREHMDNAMKMGRPQNSKKIVR
ncbi:hypothetical protein [Hydrogenophaga sp.]|jgi:hypothetical protein|uniref:hypothetical protein n=1 Tax=Hydrogenophaga sp. TaxID=1904254 RepID=UPI00260CCF10|nr:hypothetical protein [Hydrogenophaga sp.]